MKPIAWYYCRLPKTQSAKFASMVFLTGLALIGGRAQAEWKPSAQEMAMLPPYCAARFEDNKSPVFTHWRSILGEDFNHVHHYCAGLNFVARARRQVSRPQREEILGAAVREMDYVLTHARPDFSLRGEILVNRAVALSLLGKEGEAIANLEEAIRLNPRLAEAYRTLADLQVKLKQQQKALATVTAGLQHVPNDRGLQRRYDELGGAKPYPAPIQPEAARSGQESPTDRPTPVSGADTGARHVDGAAPAARFAVEQAPEPAAPASGSPAGTKKNPWCRFCPDEEPAPAPSPSTPQGGPTTPR